MINSNSSSNYLTQNDIVLEKLLPFYSVYDADGNYNPNNNLDKMLGIISGESKMSLRIVDWFVTNYAKKYYTVYYVGEKRFKVYNEYKLHLGGYNKKKLDPFCRWSRTTIPYKDGNHVETTIGQLHFFYFAIKNKVLEYIELNYDDIEKDMNARNSTSKRKEQKIDNKTRKKREELSISATKSIKKEMVEIVVKFS